MYRSLPYFITINEKFESKEASCVNHPIYMYIKPDTDLSEKLFF